MFLDTKPTSFMLSSSRGCGTGPEDLYYITYYPDMTCETNENDPYDINGVNTCAKNGDYYFSANCMASPEPVAEPVAEPIAAPMAEPMTEPIAAPMTEPVAEPISAPVSAPVAAQPVAAPVKSNTPVKKSNAVVVGSSMALIVAGIVLAF
jgi:hypothetical protein